MEIVEYGHFGPAILLLPTAAADYLEYERFLLIDAIQKYIEDLLADLLVNKQIVEGESLVLELNEAKDALQKKEKKSKKTEG